MDDFIYGTILDQNHKIKMSPLNQTFTWNIIEMGWTKGSMPIGIKTNLIQWN